MVASLKGHAEVVDKLLQHGASVDSQAVVRVSCLYTVEVLLKKYIITTGQHYLTDVGYKLQVFRSSKCSTKSQSRCEYHQ